MLNLAFVTVHMIRRFRLFSDRLLRSVALIPRVFRHRIPLEQIKPWQNFAKLSVELQLLLSESFCCSLAFEASTDLSSNSAASRICIAACLISVEMFRAMIHSKYGKEDVAVKAPKAKVSQPASMPEPEPVVINSSPVVIPVALESGRNVVLTSEVPPNGGYGWTVVFASFLISFIYLGFMKSLGAFKSAIIAEFPDALPSVMVWIFELTGTVSLIASPLAGLVMNVCGFRITIFLGGFLCCSGFALCYLVDCAGLLVCCIAAFVGTGSSFAYTSSVACIGRYFTSRLSVALALALSGGPVGALVLPTGINLVLQVLGIRYSFFALAGLFAIICLCSFAFGPPEDHFRPKVAEVFECEAHLQNESVERSDYESGCFSRFTKALSYKLALRYLRKPTFLLTAVSVFAMGMGYPHFLYYIPEQAEVLNVAQGSSVALLSYAVAISDLVSRLLYGFLAKRSVVPRSIEYSFAIAISAAAVSALPFCTEYLHLVLASVFAGIGTGMWVVVIPVLLGANHGSENLGGTFAWIRFFQGMANLIYAVVAKVLCYTVGTEAVLYYMGGSMCFAAALSILINLVLLFRKKKERVGQPYNI